jgi:hypothetical protein
MIKAATIFTYELDDPEKALRELREQLDDQIGLLQNTVGILVCDPEFIKTGVVKAVLEKFPFPIVGATSMAQAVDGEVGRLMLTLMALTSDDVSFATGVSKADSEEDIFANAGPPYEEALGRLGAKPELILLFSPFNLKIQGSVYVEAYSRLSPGTPIFGAFAMDDLPKFTDCLTIGGGGVSRDAISFVLFGGNVSPRFLAATVSEERLPPCVGKITKFQGNLLMEVNGERALKHFEKMGLAKGGALPPGLRFLPLVMDPGQRKDHNEVLIRNEVGYFDKDGFAVCRVDFSSYSTFKVGIFPIEYILAASERMIEKVNAERDVQALLMFSCIARRLSLREEPLKELYLIDEIINRDIPYMVSCTGGEICPIFHASGMLENHFYNYALIACIL